MFAEISSNASWTPQTECPEHTIDFVLQLIAAPVLGRAVCTKPGSLRATSEDAKGAIVAQECIDLQKLPRHQLRRTSNDRIYFLRRLIWNCPRSRFRAAASLPTTPNQLGTLEPARFRTFPLTNCIRSNESVCGVAKRSQRDL
jgi:hypothetical protein